MKIMYLMKAYNMSEDEAKALVNNTDEEEEPDIEE